jgi:hypothetical protein
LSAKNSRPSAQQRSHDRRYQEGLRDFQCWEMKYVPRTANSIAHVLARAAVQQGVEGMWTENPPDCIVELLVAEHLALPREE